MERYVLELVLVGAILHAGWNAIAKAGPEVDPLIKSALFNGAGAILSIPLVAYFGFPSYGAIPFLIPAVACGVGYSTGLMWSYGLADLALVYPLVRGCAVLFATLLSSLFLGDPLSLRTWIGILTLAIGIFLLASPKNDNGSFGKGVLMAVLTAGMLSGSLVLDAGGARASGNAPGYIGVLFIFLGALSGLIAVGVRGLRPTWGEIVRGWKFGLLSGTVAFGVYWLSIWAMTVRPVAVVAALRESSVLIGVLIGVFVLKEPVSLGRGMAACVILAGLVLVRLS
jgi:drug/metabolite transporter (DMT)-like permease